MPHTGGCVPFGGRQSFQGAVVSAYSLRPDFHQQFGAHLVEESKTEW
jgi:hypothetical protein